MTATAEPIHQTSSPDLNAIKAKQKIAWATGDYSVVGSTLQIVGETLCETLDLRAGARVLDVAAGNGNVSLAAARRYCRVTSTDYVAEWLASGKARANADGLDIAFREADVEALPFDDDAYDIIVSTFGVMFAPNHEQSASEMLRVCRSGGKIGLANWTPDSFIGKLFKTIGKYVTPPPGVKSPALWGTAEHLEYLFGKEASSIETKKASYALRYQSAEHWLHVWRSIYGPLQKAFAGLDEENQANLAADLISLVNELNAADDGTMVVYSDYLEVVVHKA